LRDPKPRQAGLKRLPDLFTGRQWRTLAKSFGLSTRQMQIARLICQGLTSRELATALRIAPDTVRMHRRVLFEKLGVHDRVGIPVRLVLAERMSAVNRHQ